jgi:hypothetical protein
MPCPLSDAGCTLRPSLRQASAVVPSPSRASRRMPDPAWRGWDSNPRSRAHEAREDGPSSTARGLAGWSRTSDLRFPKPAGWPAPPQPGDILRNDSAGADSWGAKIPEGVRFAPRDACGSITHRAGRGPGGARKVDDRGIEPRSTAVSERRFPSRPVVDVLGETTPHMGRRQGIAPCLPGSQPGGSLLAVRRSLAGRSRTPVPPR